MKRHISFFTFFLSIFAAVGSIRANVQYWAVSTHRCTITDSDGELLSFEEKDVDNGGYYCSKYKAGDYGVTDLNINESGNCDRIVAQEPDGLRFKGWWTKKDGWTGAEAYVNEIDTCIETNRTITGATIKNAGQWGDRPTIVAKYVPVYDIRTDVNPVGAGEAEGGGLYEEGESVSLRATAANGYGFVGWQRAGAMVSAKDSYGFQAVAGCGGTYAAVFTGNVYKVTFDRQGGAGGSQTAYVTYGQKASTPIDCPERFGWTFGGYYTERNGEGTLVYKDDGMPADAWRTLGSLTLYAKWTPNAYGLKIIRPSFGVDEIFYRLGESETWIKVATTTSVNVDCGTVCHVFARAQSGYVLEDVSSPWTGEAGSDCWMAEMTGNGLVFAPTANWSGYRLTVNPNGGTYQGSSQTYTWAERLRPGETNLNSIGVVGGDGFVGFFDGSGEPVYDAQGHNLKGTYWTDDYPKGLFRGAGDLTLLARWGKERRDVTVGSSDAAKGSVSGGGSFAEGSQVCLEAVAKDGFAFLRWEKSGSTVSLSNPYRFVLSEQTAGAYTAVFGQLQYTVSFFGNGGTNEMASQSFVSGEAKALTSNVFERAGFSFAGWLTDPTNAAPTFADGEVVSDLTKRAGGRVQLFASWTAGTRPPIETTNYLDNAYSVAADCATNRADGAVALELFPDKWCTVVTNNSEQVVKLHPGAIENADLKARVISDGILSFKRLLSGENAKNKFYFVTNNVEIAAPEGDYDEQWHGQELRVSAGTELVWSFKMKVSNPDYALIDDIRWIPDDQPTPPGPVEVETVGVTLRLNDGTPAPDDIYTNLTLEVGQTVSLPQLSIAAWFKYWMDAPDGGKITEPWTVPEAETQLYAKWTYATAAIPVAETGLVYDGNVKTGVVEGVGYTLVQNTATNAGNYSATATLARDYIWTDGKTEAKTIPWSIAKATYDLSGIALTNATYVHDGKPHALAISGTLPEGVKVSYKGNDQTEVGTHQVIASFSSEDVNYLKIERELAATLTIVPQDAPPIDPDDPSAPIVTNEVPVAVENLVYDGTAQTGVYARTGYRISGNVATNAGEYVATAYPDEGCVWPDGFASPTNIAWTIAKATVDMSGVTFASATYEYDGREHSIAVAGVPSGVEVVYSGDATNRTQVGTNTVTASFTVLDAANYNEITTKLTAKLVIAEQPPPPDPTVGYENIYFKATLAELGATAVPTNRKITIKAEGLPKGLKLVTTALKDAMNKATGFYAYAVEGVPTETMDGLSRRAYVRVTDSKVQTLYVLNLKVLPAAEFETKAFPDGTNQAVYVNFSVTNLWPDVAKNPKNWTFSGWPSGIRYATKDTKDAKACEIYGKPTKAGRFTVKAVEKIAGTSCKSAHAATFTVWPDGKSKDEWTDQAHVGVYRKSDENVKSASGLPPGVKFTAKDIVSKKVVTTEAHHFYGKPTKAGTYAVTLTHEDRSKTQFLWTITPADAPSFELQLTETAVNPATAKATIRQGVGYNWTIGATDGATVTASGLPTGLKIVKTAIKSGTKTVGYDYSVAGVPTKAGEFFVKFTTKLNGVSTVTTAAFTVLELPAWAQGTFGGGADETFAVGGQATFTVSKAGKLSGKWLSEGANWTLSATAYDRYDEATASYIAQTIGKSGSGKNARVFTNELTVSEDPLGGVATNALFLAYQNNWKLEPWKAVGKKVAKAPVFEFKPYADAGDDHTNDFVSLKFAATGKVTVKASSFKSISSTGKISWTTASGSAVLCPQGLPEAGDAFPAVVFVYLPPKKGTPTADAAYAVCVRLWWDGAKFVEWVEPE